METSPQSSSSPAPLGREGGGNCWGALGELPGICRGNPSELGRWIDHPTRGRLVACLVAITLGCGAYGYTLGVWRAAEMGNMVAMKLPLLILLTLGVNGAVNVMVGQLLGGGLGVRQTLLALLMSFASFSLIAGSLSPITLGMALNSPRPGEAGARSAYEAILLTHTVLIAFAGIVSHKRFMPVLNAACGSAKVGKRVFLAWLGGNLFVGAQLSWNLRPFFGQPGREIEFLRDDWNRSNFYESLFHTARQVLLKLPLFVVVPLILCSAMLLGFYLILRKRAFTQNSLILRNHNPK